MLELFGPLLHLQALPTLLLQLVPQSPVLLLQTSPFFLQAFGLVFAFCTQLPPSLEVFHQSWIRLL
jgi:hypothetical protein